MLDGKRKSMQPMAERLGVDHQQQQQFVSSSTWDYTEARRRVARWAAAQITPEAYAIDDVGFPKDGYDSPGVARMYCGALGRRGDCQIPVSINLVSDTASSAVDWRLFLPESWDDAKNNDDELLAGAIRRRRARTGIPDQARHLERWRLALEMLDEVRREWELPDLPVATDAGYGDATGFRQGLTERGLAYAVAVAVKGSTTCYPGNAVPQRPAYSGQGRPPGAAYQQPHTTLRALATTAGGQAVRTVTWRHGSKATRDNPRAAEPTDYWLSTPPADTPPRELVRIAKIRWRVEHDYRETAAGTHRPLANHQRVLSHAEGSKLPLSISLPTKFRR
ncbi:IS701 family transposase [Streptomyces niphimycinicus]